MGRPTKTSLPDIEAAHDAIVEAHGEILTSMMANPPRNDTEVDRYRSILQQFRTWNKTFQIAEDEVDLYSSPDPNIRKQSRITNIKELLMINSACLQSIALHASIVQRRKELDATIDRTAAIQRIADRVKD